MAPVEVDVHGAAEVTGEGADAFALERIARIAYPTPEEPGRTTYATVSLDDGSPGPEPHHVVPLFGTGDHRDLPDVSGPDDGSGANVFVTASWEPMALSGARAAVFDGERWSSVAGSCERPGQGLFATADGTFWSFWLEGETVRWGTFVRVD